MPGDVPGCSIPASLHGRVPGSPQHPWEHSCSFCRWQRVCVLGPELPPPITSPPPRTVLGFTSSSQVPGPLVVGPLSGPRLPPPSPCPPTCWSVPRPGGCPLPPTSFISSVDRGVDSERQAVTSPVRTVEILSARSRFTASEGLRDESVSVC